MPAPQALLAEKRLNRLPIEEDVTSCASVFSGHEQASLNYFPNILHGTGAEHGAYTVKEISIVESHIYQAQRQNQLEMHSLGRRTRQRSFQWRAGSIDPHIRPLWTGPLACVTLLSYIDTLGLLVWAAVAKDVVAVIGIALVSVATSCLCAANQWRLELVTAPRTALAGATGDIVVRTKDGCFTVIHCSGRVAESLYFNTERRVYGIQHPRDKLLVIAGGMCLIAGIVFFGNCSWNLQLGLVLVYTHLNIAHWMVAGLPHRFHWDTSHYVVDKEVLHENARNYTSALWYAIHCSKSTDWVRATRAVPQSHAWDAWLIEAREHLRYPPQNWEPQTALKEAFLRNALQ